MPKVAIAPLVLLWIGYGLPPNMIVAASVGFFRLSSTRLALHKDWTMIRTGEQYRASLRDDRQVWMDGVKVIDFDTALDYGKKSAGLSDRVPSRKKEEEGTQFAASSRSP